MQLVQSTASLLGGSGLWNSCNPQPHCLGVVGSATSPMHYLITRGCGHWDCCNTLRHCLGQWAVPLLQYFASLPRGSGQWNSCIVLPHGLGAVGSATPEIHSITAWGRWEVLLLQRTA